MPKPPFLPIETERLRLRLLEERDLPLTLAWRNQDQVRRWFLHDQPIAPTSTRPGTPSTAGGTMTSCS